MFQVNVDSIPRPIPWLSYATNAHFVSDNEYHVLGWEFEVIIQRYYCGQKLR